MRIPLSLLTTVLILGTSALSHAQERNYNPPTMMLNVGNFSMSMNKLMGDGGLQSQFSWNLTGSDRQETEIFYWPADWWQSNMLYQIFNPLSLDDNGIIDEYGVQRPMFTRGDALTNFGATDWAIETRRYRPPHIIVDGIQIDPPYRWNIDPTLPSDIKLEFEDVLGQFGIRSRVEVYAFSNSYHADYFIWKATHKFTGEIRLPRLSSASTDTLPDQTIRFWWPIAFSFGPTKAGERNVMGAFAYEGEDDLDSWFKRKSELVPSRSRDSLVVAYYWDTRTGSTQPYPNGSIDDTGDPDRTSGFLYSTQIPGYTLLHADRAFDDRSDDPAQPYALAHATIVGDLWGRRDVGLKATYRGDDARGRFPPDAITAGFSTTPEKGPMRLVTAGPYTLTKNRAQGRIDSISLVYAVGVGGLDWAAADSLGALWPDRCRIPRRRLGSSEGVIPSGRFWTGRTGPGTASAEDSPFPLLLLLRTSKLSLAPTTLRSSGDIRLPPISSTRQRSRMTGTRGACTENGAPFLSMTPSTRRAGRAGR
jgi:hypothetical protein